ncbi:MAG: glutamate-cysteine ligase family protein, partial [Sciscionella sp.]
ATLSALLSDADLVLGATGADPHRPPRRLLHTPRYEAMEAAFAPIGADGLRMMCSTAGVQVCLDAGSSAELPDRWAALHALGPVLCALFANSRTVHGASVPWASMRQRVLFRTDPARMRPAAVSTDPAAAWARRAVDTAVICVRDNGGRWVPQQPLSFAEWIASRTPRPPTVDDLSYHLSTLFPPVRPHGYIEVRYLDAQAGEGWMDPVALLAALLADPSTVRDVLEITAPARHRWLTAARHGLADDRLRASASAVVALGVRALAATDLPPALAGSIAQRLEQRLTTAHDIEG